MCEKQGDQCVAAAQSPSAYYDRFTALRHEHEARIKQNILDFNNAILSMQQEFGLSKDAPIQKVKSEIEPGNPSTVKEFLNRAEQSLYETPEYERTARLREECHALRVRNSFYEERVQQLEVRT